MNFFIDDSIFNFAYGAALHDATIQKAYRGDKKLLRKNTEAKKIINEYIDKIFDGATEDFYITAQKIEQSFACFLKQQNSDEQFTFGNTQKLINMTVKYMYIATYHNEDLRINFKNCHCPMDSIMVDTVIKHMNKLCDNDKIDIQPILTEKYVCTKDQKVVKWTTYLKEPWSRMVFESDGKNNQYELFQKIVKFLADREGLSPIEYDYKEWEKAL